VSVNTVVGVIDDTLESRARKALEEGFTLLKIKLGLRPWLDELPELQAFSSTLPEGVMLRLDTNGAWDSHDARQALNALRDLPVEALEEPLACPRPETLQRLQTLVPWPLALDESLRAWPLEDLLKNPPVNRLILKPMILGGVLPSLQLARRARRAGLECVITTTVDSAAGVWAALHLAAALDNNLAHGLDTAAWLAEDTGCGPLVQSASMRINETSGLGFAPFPNKLDFKTP
jgi:L-alanine-DL-glutamate epimerase-like enolase superfamily enzyme